MRAPRRAVKLRSAPRRAKPDTSGKLTVEPDGFVRNEWLETLSRIKADQPKRYAREVSAGLQVTVRKYEELKEEHERRQSPRAAEGKGTDERTTWIGFQRPAHRAAGQP
jgi:hypothetical protein